MYKRENIQNVHKSVHVENWKFQFCSHLNIDNEFK